MLLSTQRILCRNHDAPQLTTGRHCVHPPPFPPPTPVQLAETYGNVFCIRVGQEKTVFVCGWKTVKEVLVTQADKFVDRPYQALFSRLYNQHKGSGSTRKRGGTHTWYHTEGHQDSVTRCAHTFRGDFVLQRQDVEDAASLRHGNAAHLRPGRRHAGEEHLPGEPTPATGYGRTQR